MAQPAQPIMIKKYANRRLYHTGTSTYVTLDDLSEMVHGGEDFVVSDAKTGEDITRSVLTQIIFEQENKVGQGGNLLPISFLRQLIRFYGDSMQALVPKYLEFSLDRLTTDQQKFRDQLNKSFGTPGFTGPGILPSALPGAFKMIEEQARANMTMFTEALRLFSPFGLNPGSVAGSTEVKPEASALESSKTSAEIDEFQRMKQQLGAMQAQLDKMDKKS